MSRRLLDNTDAVLFDLDGTLLDTALDLGNALRIVCEENNHPVPDLGAAAGHVSNGAAGMLRFAFPDADEDRIEIMRQRMVAVYEDNICVHTTPFDGVTTLLQALDDADIPWGIVTNKMRYLAAPILEQLELLPRCRTLVGGDTAARSKPHPDPLVLALGQLGMPAARSIYVGDAAKDVAAGRAAGMTTVVATWGYLLPDDNVDDWDPHYTIDHPDQLLTLTAG